MANGTAAMTPLVKYLLLVAGGILCLPASLLTAIFALNAINPMAIAFLTDFTVENQSGEPIEITPVGAIGKEGRRKTLPLSMVSGLHVPPPSDRSFSLPVGARREFTYDWDDIQISELLIVPSSGPARQLVIDANPTERQYHPPQQTFLVVPELTTLPRATPQVHNVLKQRGLTYFLWPIFGIGIAAPIGILLAWMKLTALQRSQRHRQLAPSGSSGV